MRIWVGNEMEGVYTGDLTMFVESNVIDTKTIDIINMFIDNYSIKGLYLGAGRVDITKCDTLQLRTILLFCKKQNVHVTYEFSSYDNMPPELINELVSFEVLTVYRKDIDIGNNILKSFANRLVVKMDNKSTVMLSKFDPSSTVDVTTVNNGLYNGVDKLIYN